jgi:hypothetical protein
MDGISQFRQQQGKAAKEFHFPLPTFPSHEDEQNEIVRWSLICLVSSTHPEPLGVTKVKLLPEYCSGSEGYDISSSGPLAAIKLTEQFKS